MSYTKGKHGGRRTAGPGKRIGRPPIETDQLYVIVRVNVQSPDEAYFIKNCLTPDDRGDALIGQITRGEWFSLDPPRRLGGRRLRAGDGSKVK